MDILRQKLEKNLTRIAEEFLGVMGIALKDLEAGDELLVNGDEVFPIASSIKIAILMEFFRKVEEGAIKPKEPLTLSKEHMVGGSGVLKELGEGTVTMSLLDYATLMITVSDNTATNICVDLAGMDEVNGTLAQLGLKTTRLARRMMDMEGLLAGKENISTPREMMQLMKALYKRRGLSPWVCEKTLEVLKKPKEGIIEGVIRNAVPDDIDIADKSGWVEGATCDVGIVYLPRRPYALALLAKHVPVTDPKKLNAMRTMTLATRLIHEYFTEIDSATPHGRRISIQTPTLPHFTA